MKMMFGFVLGACARNAPHARPARNSRLRIVDAFSLLRAERFLLAVNRDERMAHSGPVFIRPVARETAELILEIANRRASHASEIGPGLGLFGEVRASLLFAVLKTDFDLIHIAEIVEPGMQRGGGSLQLDAGRLDFG